MIINKTKHITISKDEIICKNIFSQTRGLMFRKKQNLVMVFKKERKVRLHNFFVFYPIDVIILNKNKKIVEIKQDFKPFTFWNSKKKGKYIIELGAKQGVKQRVKQGAKQRTKLSENKVSLSDALCFIVIVLNNYT